MDELMEVITGNQFGVHNCGVVIYSVDVFYDGWWSGRTPPSELGSSIMDVRRVWRK